MQRAAVTEEGEMEADGLLWRPLEGAAGRGFRVFSASVCTFNNYVGLHSLICVMSLT